MEREKTWNAWIKRDNEYTRCYTFRYTIIEFRLCEATRVLQHIHTKHNAFSTFARTSYINRSIDSVGNATFYRINNIGHKADSGWKMRRWYFRFVVKYVRHMSNGIATNNNTLTPWANFIIKSTLFDSVSRFDFVSPGGENPVFFFSYALHH